VVFPEKDLAGVTPERTTHKEQLRRGCPTVTEARVRGVVALTEAELPLVRTALLALPAGPELACVVATSPAPGLAACWLPSPIRGIVWTLVVGAEPALAHEACLVNVGMAHIIRRFARPAQASSPVGQLVAEIVAWTEDPRHLAQGRHEVRIFENAQAQLGGKA
jgi:hypothetical protein